MAVDGRRVDLDRLASHDDGGSGSSCASWHKTLHKRGGRERHGVPELHWLVELTLSASACSLGRFAVDSQPSLTTGAERHRRHQGFDTARKRSLGRARERLCADKTTEGPWGRFPRFARDRRAAAFLMHTTSPSTVTETSPECTPTRKLTLPDPQGDGDEGLQPPRGPRADVVEQQRPGSPRFDAIVPFIHVRRRLHFI